MISLYKYNLIILYIILYIETNVESTKTYNDVAILLQTDCFRIV